MKEKIFINKGVELNFFKQPQFESTKHRSREEKNKIIPRNALRLLMMGWSDDWKKLRSWPLFKAIFISRDPSLLIEMRKAFQEGFYYVFEQLQNQRHTPSQLEQIQLYLSNCLSLLPYSDITPYESINIPQYINEKWVMIEYKITPIELTDPEGFKHFLIQDSDRVFAYGLEPLINKNAQPHLIFMGTTYPAGQGFWEQIKSDLRPFRTVGYSLYKSGRKKISEWIDKQNKKPGACGVSLGGTLSLIAAMDQGNKLSRVDALNPAGLYQYDDKKFDHWNNLTEKPKVIIQQQGNDPVSRLGVWKKDWKFLKITPPKDKKGPNGFVDHPSNYAGLSGTKISQLNIEIINKKGTTRNFWIYKLGRAIIYYSCIIPLYYFFRPAYHAVGMKLLFSSLLFASFLTLFFISSFPLLKIAFIPFLSVTAGSVVHSLVHKLKTCFDTRKQEIPKFHDPNLPRIKKLDLYENDIEIKLKGKKLYSYYYVIRCLLKEKPYLPEKRVKSDQFKGHSKKGLLKRVKKKENANKKYRLKITKAKYYLMTSIITLFEQSGAHKKDKLKKEADSLYQQYHIGKKHS